MKRIFIVTGLVVGAFLLILVAVTGSFMIRGGAFRDVVVVDAGLCQTIRIPDGSAEDIQPDRDNNLALLSVLDRRSIVTGTAGDGTIARLSLKNDVNGSPTTIEPALASQPDVFQPHGISLFESPDGTQTLFAINHAFGAGEFIEVFEKPAGQDLFDHIQTLSSPLLISPNDLVAVGRRKFYVANDSGADNAFERGAEMMFAIGLSPLVHYDGSNFEVVVDDLKSSGGINVNLERSELYVGETIGETIRIYALNADGSLAEEKDTVAVGSGVDNIDVDPTGTLWIANHINTVALIQHFADEASPAPTQVQRISLNGAQPTVQTVYEQDGTAHSAGSVAVRFGDALLVGSITEKQVLYCQMEGDQP